MHQSQSMIDFTNSIVDWFYLCMNEQLFDIIENINDFESI